MSIFKMHLTKSNKEKSPGVKTMITPSELEYLALPGVTTAEDIFKLVSIDAKYTGLIYFLSPSYKKVDLPSMLKFLNVENYQKYAYCQKRSTNYREGYLTQIRFMSEFGLSRYYSANDISMNNQDVDLYDAAVSFVEEEKALFDSETAICRQLNIEDDIDGHLDVGFGFLVEDPYYGIYRLWSRVVHFHK